MSGARRRTITLATALSLAALPALGQAQSTRPAPASPPAQVAQPARDGVRLRGGIALVAGPYLPYGTTNLQSTGGAAGLAVRFGAQFNHYVGLYVHSQNLGGAIGAQSTSGTVSGAVMFHSQNALLASITIAHTVEMGAGPSLDVLAFGNCDSASLSCASGINTGLGAHARFALLLGGWNPSGPRRFGMSISADLHPIKYVGQDGGLLATVFGLGLDWF
ncbi:MAG: hypothetical protein JNK05_06020 [Myxococcales bacterium]|nr:hypothetical protein [Myxococcales bacterium]